MLILYEKSFALQKDILKGSSPRKRDEREEKKDEKKKNEKIKTALKKKKKRSFGLKKHAEFVGKRIFPQKRGFERAKCLKKGRGKEGKGEKKKNGKVKRRSKKKNKAVI